MKPRLVLLSDLWGNRRSHWWNYYTQLLGDHYQLKWYDSCELAGLQMEPYEQEHLHQQFVNGGIERAVTSLTQAEERFSAPRIVLGFSVGGVIGWKAIQARLAAQNFYAVSATRLRYENEALRQSGCLWYGKKDSYKPTQDWLTRQHLDYQLLDDCFHDCYREPSVIKLIADTLFAKVTN